MRTFGKFANSIRRGLLLEKKMEKNYLRIVHYLVNNELFSHFFWYIILIIIILKKTNSWEKHFKHSGLLKTENEYY